MLLSVVGGLALVLAALLSVLAARSVVVPLRRVQRSLDAAGQGDLTVDSGVTQRDEVGEMAASLAVMQANLREVLSSVVTSSGPAARSSAWFASPSPVHPQRPTMILHAGNRARSRLHR